jgi:acyl carrier protein
MRYLNTPGFPTGLRVRTRAQIRRGRAIVAVARPCRKDGCARHAMLLDTQTTSVFFNSMILYDIRQKINLRPDQFGNQNPACRQTGRQDKGAPMDHAAIMAKLEELMIDVFDVDDLVVTEATSADDVEEWDSLSHIRFMITVERFFKIRFLNEAVAELKNVGDLARTIAAKLD